MPDVEIKPQRYRDDRPKEFFDKFPRVTVSYGRPLRFDVEVSPTRDQQQEAADLIPEWIRVIHHELARLGHRGSLRAARRHAVA